MASSEGACGVRRFMCVLYTHVSYEMNTMMTDTKK